MTTTPFDPTNQPTSAPQVTPQATNVQSVPASVPFTPTPQAQTQAPAPQAQANRAPAQAEQAQQGQAPAPQTGNDIASLPQWAQDHITSLRNENAERRVKLNAAEESLRNAKTVEEFQAAQAQWATASAELERENVALSYGLPRELAGRIQGKDRAEMERDAQALRALIVPQAPPPPAPVAAPGGGLTPQAQAQAFDPIELASRTGRNGMARSRV